MISGDKLEAALETVATDWICLALNIRNEDAYSDHITEQQKNEFMIADLVFAETIRNGEIKSFTIWQRINTVLTGECVAFLP